MDFLSLTTTIFFHFIIQKDKNDTALLIYWKKYIQIFAAVNNNASVDCYHVELISFTVAPIGGNSSIKIERKEILVVHSQFSVELQFMCFNEYLLKT